MDTFTHDFGWALRELKEGREVARAGWHGKGMYVRRLDPSPGYGARYELRDPTGTFYAWVCSQRDMDDEDWGPAT